MCVVTSDGEGQWKFEAKLGQSVTMNVDAVNVGLTDTFSDVVTLHIQSAAGLVSAGHSTSSIQSCTRLKVSLTAK